MDAGCVILVNAGRPGDLPLRKPTCSLSLLVPTSGAPGRPAASAPPVAEGRGRIVFSVVLTVPPAACRAGISVEVAVAGWPG